MAEITISSLSYNSTIANEFVMNLLLDIDFFRNEILSPLIYSQFSYSLQISRKTFATFVYSLLVIILHSSIFCLFSVSLC